MTILSRFDLPLIRDAILELYRTIENPPAENWQAPNWLLEQYKQTTARKIPLQPGEKPTHTWLIKVAEDEVLNRLTPPWSHSRDDCPEITESALDRQKRVALLELRERLLSFGSSVILAGNKAESDSMLNFLDVVLGRLAETEKDAPQYLTLNQIAAFLHKSKKTMERWKARQKNPFPPADNEGGGGGKADEWIWANVKPWLEQETKRILPDAFPELFPR